MWEEDNSSLEKVYWLVNKYVYIYIPVKKI